MYRYVLTELDGSPVSELPGAFSRNVAVPILSGGSGGFSVLNTHRDAEFLLNCEGLVKVYEEDRDLWSEPQLRAHGELLSAEEAANTEAGTIACTFADPFWITPYRLIGKSAQGYSKFSGLAPDDVGLIIKDMIDVVNAEKATGLRVGSVTPSTNGYLANVRYAKLSDQIAQLSATLDGPDWRVNPIELDSAGNYGELVIAASLSAVRPKAAFEFGDGKRNVASYQRVVTKIGSATRVYSLPPGFPDSATLAVLMEEDPTAQAGALGLLEDVISTDLEIDALRTQLLLAHIAVRSSLRQTFNFTVARNMPLKTLPRFGLDYDSGDVVPFRATVWNGGEAKKLVDVMMRIYSTSLDIDDASGLATPTLTVAPGA